MFLKGMYVSCPVKLQGTGKKESLYVVGKIEHIDEDTDIIKVRFFDYEKYNEKMQLLLESAKYYNAYELIRAFITPGITALYNGCQKVMVIKAATTLKGKLGHRVYYCKINNDKEERIIPISEERLEINFLNIELDVKEQLYKFHNSSYEWYTKRIPLSERKNYLEKLPKVISTLIDTRVFLYAHQIDTVIKATVSDTCRVMLSDEVGLGKTIEAITILKHYMDQDVNFRCLVVVPISLEYQWLNELKYKFGINAEIFSITQHIQKKIRNGIVVMSYDNYVRYRYELLEKKWDMVILDEVHKILNKSIYKPLFQLCVKVKNVVLLSATPVQRQAKEYLNLLKMLNPIKYHKVSEKNFLSLVAKQRVIQDKIYDMLSDLQIYEDIDMSDMFVFNLRDINKILQDQFLERIIEKIDGQDSKVGLLFSKMAIEYLRYTYIIETPFIRHRRVDIKEAGIKRSLFASYAYEMPGKDIDSAEAEVYDMMLDEISKSFKVDSNMNDKEYYMRFISALHSSPYALIPILNEGNITYNNCNNLRKLASEWRNFCDREIRDIIKGRNQDLYSRFGCLYKAVSDIIEGKIIIFTGFEETASVIAVMLEALYGKNSIVKFTKKMSRLELQLAARKFQNEDDCRFIVCDETGGEGRNFQCADYIIHFDMPWSPALMEQRIGRLDRIGRDTNRDVNSIVIYAEDSLEEKLFELYKNSLDVFEQSLCGLEIIFEQMSNMITKALVTDMKYGLTHVAPDIEKMISVMQEDVERELYFSNIQTNDIEQQIYIKEITECFEKEKDIQMTDEYVDWLITSGVPVKYLGNDIYKVNFESYDINRIRTTTFYSVLNAENQMGTFSRTKAISNEDIAFISPGSTICELIYEHLNINQNGRFAAVRSQRRTTEWCGIMTVWNVKYNYELLLRQGKESVVDIRFDEYFSNEQIKVAIKISGIKDYNESEIATLIQKEKHEFEEIRCVEETCSYEKIYDEHTWKSFCENMLDRAKKEALKATKLRNRKNLLEELLQKREFKRRINNKSVDIRPISNLYTWGLENPCLYLDSIIYVEL